MQILGQNKRSTSKLPDVIYDDLPLSKLLYLQRFTIALDDWCLVLSCLSNILLVVSLITALQAHPGQGINTSDILHECLRWLALQWVFGFAALAWRKAHPSSYLKWRTYALFLQRVSRVIWFHSLASFLHDDVSSGCFKLIRSQTQSPNIPLPFLPQAHTLFRTVLLTSLALTPLSHALQVPLPPIPNSLILTANTLITLRTAFWPAANALSHSQLPFRDLCDLANYLMRVVERGICCVPQDPDFFDNSCTNSPLLPLITFVHLYFALALPTLLCYRIQSYIEHLISISNSKPAVNPAAPGPAPLRPRPAASSLHPLDPESYPDHPPPTSPGAGSAWLILEHLIWNLMLAVALLPALWVVAMHLHPLVAYWWSRRVQPWQSPGRICHSVTVADSANA